MNHEGDRDNQTDTMTTKTLETQPPSNTVAVSTPTGGLNYPEIVRTCAKRKVDNGAQFSSTKGKTSLLNVCIDTARSQLNIAKRDADGKPVNLPDDVFQNIKLAVNQFWHNEARELVDKAIAEDAHITIRRGVLMSKVSDKGEVSRSKTDKITSVYKPLKSEHRLCDMFGLSAAKSRLDSMLEQVGKWSRMELDAQRRKIAILEDCLAAKDEVK